MKEGAKSKGIMVFYERYRTLLNLAKTKWQLASWNSHIGFLKQLLDLFEEWQMEVWQKRGILFFLYF